MASSDVDLDELQRFRITLDRVTQEMAKVRKDLSHAVDESKSFWDDEQRPILLAKYSVVTLPMITFEKKSRDYSDWASRKHKAGMDFLKGRR